MSREETASILADLDGSKREAAWRRFLDLHSARLMQIARHHAHYEDHAQDCFQRLCEMLCENGFQRLRQFDPAQGVLFESWLSAVANNLARDWRRRRFGRQRAPAAIAKLESSDREVFRLRFEQRLPAETCLALLQDRVTGYTQQDLGQSLERIHRALTPRQRWRMATLGTMPEQRTVPLDDESEPAHPDSDPEQAAASAQQSKSLNAALARLDPDQRLALRLRFEKHLALKDVAVLLGLDNLHQARRRIEAALARLRELLPDD